MVSWSDIFIGQVVKQRVEGVLHPAIASGLTDHPWSHAELLNFKVPPSPWQLPKQRGRPSTAMLQRASTLDKLTTFKCGDTCKVSYRLFHPWELNASHRRSYSYKPVLKTTIKLCLQLNLEEQVKKYVAELQSAMTESIHASPQTPEEKNQVFLLKKRIVDSVLAEARVDENRDIHIMFRTDFLPREG